MQATALIPSPNLTVWLPAFDNARFVHSEGVCPMRECAGPGNQGKVFFNRVSILKQPCVALGPKNLSVRGLAANQAYRGASSP